MTAEIRKRVDRVILEHLGVDQQEITPQANIIMDLRADSLDALELILGLEEEFAIEIGDEQAEQIKTVGDAYSVVEEAMGVSA